MVEISHHSQIDSPWLRNYTTDHFPALISHFPDHWLHYVKAIITLIFCRKCSRSQLNIFRRLKMFSDALAKSGETRWSHLRDYVEKSNQRHWHMSAGWIIFNMVLYKTLVMDIWSEAVVRVWTRGQRESFFHYRDENESFSDSISHIETRPRISDT